MTGTQMGVGSGKEWERRAGGEEIEGTSTSAVLGQVPSARSPPPEDKSPVGKTLRNWGN